MAAEKWKGPRTRKNTQNYRIEKLYSIPTHIFTQCINSEEIPEEW